MRALVLIVVLSSVILSSYADVAKEPDEYDKAYLDPVNYYLTVSNWTVNAVIIAPYHVVTSTVAFTAIGAYSVLTVNGILTNDTNKINYEFNTVADRTDVKYLSMTLAGEIEYRNHTYYYPSHRDCAIRYNPYNRVQSVFNCGFNVVMLPLDIPIMILGAPIDTRLENKMIQLRPWKVQRYEWVDPWPERRPYKNDIVVGDPNVW